MDCLILRKRRSAIDTLITRARIMMIYQVVIKRRSIYL